MKRIGMEPVLLSWKDVVPALEKGGFLRLK